MSTQDKTIDRYVSIVDAVTGYPIIRDKTTDSLLMMAHVAERMNRYELLLQRAKRLSLNSRNYNHTGSEYSRVESIDIQFLDESIDELLAKTTEQLLQELIDAADALSEWSRIGSQERANRVNTYNTARAAYEASES